MALLLDSNVLIDYLRDNREAVRFVEAQPEQPNLSVASVVEIYAGARTRQEEQRIDQLLAQSKQLPVNAEIAKRAGAFVRLYLRSHAVEPMDAIIAATAEHHGLRLATLNTKHFPMFPKLKRAY